MAGQDGEHEAKGKEKSRGPLGDLSQHVAGTRAEERVGRTAAKSHADAGFFLRQLQQHQEHQQDAIHHQNKCKKSNN